jgi:DNA-binding protein Fis
MAEAITEDQIIETVQAYHAAGNNKSAAARLLGIGQSTMSKRLDVLKMRGLIRERDGKLEALTTEPWTRPARGKVLRYLLTSAQNHTKIHQEFWKNLHAMAVHYDATLMVSTFKYNKDAFANNVLGKKRVRISELPDDVEYDPEIVPYISNDRIDLAPRLTWCGELNILPTARKPLTGMENYTYRKSTIIPHTTIALKSVAAVKGEGVKLLYTTGACTQRNYIKRKEGFRAEHFHAYAALLVEVDSDGNWWCRQVEQGADGTLCDLNLVFRAGKLARDGARVACITWGDIHATKLDQRVADAGWREPGNMLDTLRPYSQHVHDLLDFTPASHHTRKDPFENYRAYMRNDRRSVANELMSTGQVAAALQRKWCRTVVVNSNHDRHLERYLKEIDWREDSENAELVLRLTERCLRAIRLDDKAFNLVEFALKEGCALPLDGLDFLHEDESDVILRQIDGGIECGMHGDRGANGSKGTAAGIARMGRKINMADKHSVEIVDLVYVAGVSGQLDMGYNKGPSSWTQAHIVTYNNGCRAIVSVWKGKWRA